MGGVKSNYDCYNNVFVCIEQSILDQDKALEKKHVFDS